jgi:hypothetical protein
MNMENFTTKTKTSFDKFIRTGFLSAALFLLAFGTAQAQCPLGCNNSVQISLDTDCMVEVTPDMVLEGQGTTGCDYTVQVLGSDNQPIPTSPIVGAAYIGETLTVKISLGANSCWGSITIEDKLPPVIDCPGDMTVSCYQSSDFPNPIATDNCDGNIAVDVVSDDIVDLDCNNEFSARRTIIYQATDGSGNKSAFCTKNIFFERIELTDIVFPENRDDVELPSLECDNIPAWDTNNDGYPQPEETGTPTTLDGFNIFPNNSYCELNATFADQVLPICESSFKVLRTWTVLDWCTAEIREEFQIVKVVDNENPIVTTLQDLPFATSADPYDCEADWLVPAPIIIFDCSSTSYTVQYLLADNNGAPPVDGLYIDDDVTTNPDGTFTINNLPLGRTWVRYTVMDACGNITFAFVEIDVVDDVPPVPVCDEFTVATLTNNGYAHIFAETFDDGSHDNCSDVTFEVRRMTPGCGASTSAWTEFAEFCCDDIGSEVMVSLRVTDESGNSNTCMVIVNVQDKLDPVIECPPNITVDCGTDISDLGITGMATASDNCGDAEITMNDSGSLNDCGVGTIFRRFTATDAGGRSVNCTQRITVEDDSPFLGGSINWPPNRTLNGCAMIDTDPENTGVPTYNDDLCSQVADTYEDQTFTFVDDVCLKILRTWTVIDWCTFDQNNPNDGGIYQYTQVIKVSNNVKPVFNTCSDITVDAFGQDCNGFAEIIVGATDDCTPEEELNYAYTLDEFNDGSIDAVGSTNDASQTLEVGTHSITFTVEDQCGNQEICSFLVRVLDKKKPTPYCLSEITTVIMPSSGQIDIWASDFDLGSVDNCPGDVLISFSSNVNNTQRFFNCDQLGMNDVEIWVTDASGNQDFCTTTINIQDNGGCTGSKISGLIANTNDEMINEVKVTKTNMNNYSSEFYMTPFGGGYNFVNPAIETSYEIKAEKDTDHTNGVSTLDLVLVQRHILGLQELDSPYKVIAGDVNNSESLTSSDLLELRKLILGIKTEFSNNQSWRFVDAAQTFSNNNDPFPFNEEVMILNYNNENVSGKNFVGVKIGDVNGSALVSNLTEGNTSSTRSNNSLSLNMDNVSYKAGDLVSIPVTAENFTDMVGFQFTLEAAGMTLEDVKAGALNITTDNVATFNKEESMTFSWNTATELSTDENEVLFTLVMRANTNNELSNSIEVTSKITTAEAYNSSLEIDGVEVNVRGEYANVDVQFELFQNTPNPFDGYTTIPFNLPETGNVTLNVFDITGKVIYNTRGEFTKGMNEITLDNSNMTAKGIMYYQLEYNGTVATKKMISL